MLIIENTEEEDLYAVLFLFGFVDLFVWVAQVVAIGFQSYYIPYKKAADCERIALSWQSMSNTPSLFWITSGSSPSERSAISTCEDYQTEFLCGLFVS